ncbi:C1 family peptidase [candidate division CSSED10-310 bacterium]|uniref:C1 family peptidase n=1 Tax=candidate division CSSED10-310 bacterium TaxID=2855610 RepID=A0ABV6YWU4_UNCC1
MNRLTREFLHLIGETIAKVEKIERARWKPSFNNYLEVLIDDLQYLCGHIPAPHELTLEERDKIAAENYKKHLESKEPPLDVKRDYPKYFNWLDVDGQNYITPVKNQVFCAACSAFGSVAAVESAVRISKDISALSPEDNAVPLLSEAQVFFSSAGDHNCKTGWTLEKALDYCQQIGVIPAEYYPYYPNEQRPELPPNWHDMVTQISGYEKVTSHAEMKNALTTKGPLVTIMTVYLDFCLYGTGIYSYVIGPKIGAHCICCIGFDDEKQAWLCKNSWGTHWGEQGFFWIGYGECGIDAEMWSINGLTKIYTSRT